MDFAAAHFGITAMTQSSDLTQTALIVADYRARESSAPNPLYDDPIVPLFLNEDTRKMADRVAGDFPADDGVRLRTRYFDDKLNEQLDHGCRQVVILGSGLDTRAIRKQASGVTYFEIDDASILDFKQMRLAEAGIEVRAAYVPGNYVVDGVRGLLASHGFDHNAPTYFIWEGNTMYLSRPVVVRLLKDLRDGLKTFAISFDYFSEAVITGTSGDDKLSSLAQRFADIGAPFTFGIDDIDALAHDVGLEVVDSPRIGTLFGTFWPHRKAESWHAHYGFCTLQSQRRTYR